MKKLLLIIKIIGLFLLMVFNMMSQTYEGNVNTEIKTISYQVQLPNGNQMKLNRQIRIPHSDNSKKSSLLVQKKIINENTIVYTLQSSQNEYLAIYKFDPIKNKYFIIFNGLINVNESELMLNKETNENYTILIFKSDLGYYKLEKILW